MTELEARAADLDRADPLAPLRAVFHIPDGLIYLDGNSLGLMPKSVPSRLARTATDDWAEGLVRSWQDPDWYDLPVRVGNRIAPLIGAGADEVIVGDSTSVNIYKCLGAALALNPARRVILAEGNNFPTDSYMAQGLATLVPDVSLRYFGPDQDPATLVGDDVAVVLASHVDYRTSQVKDMGAVSAAVQAEGALMLWDLCHSAGAVACDLAGSGADLAVGCTYKYLNGGPGAPAFAWANPAHLPTLSQPLTGWHGHAKPFDFQRDFAPVDGARRFICGTPQILSLAALDEALKLWGIVDLTALWAKSQAMTGLFIEAVETLCAGHGLTLISPRQATERGSHVMFECPQGFAVVQALIARNIIGDYREPAGMRFGLAPLYLSYGEVVGAAIAMAEILNTGEWDRDIYRQRGTVT